MILTLWPSSTGTFAIIGPATFTSTIPAYSIYCTT